MDKKYISVTTAREARARSKRLREAGGWSGSPVALVSEPTLVQESVAVGDGHTHSNKSSLDQITTDVDGYEWLTRLVEHVETDEETGEERSVYERLTEKVKAGFADLARTLSEDSPVWNMFLSRLHADRAAGRIDFLEGLRSLGDAEFGEFVEGLYAGKGGRIDSGGNAEVESLRVRTSMEVMELIVNRLSAIEGDELRSESDTITEVEDLGGGTYKLHLKDKYEGYFTAQYEHNILRGVFNTLPAKLNGLSDVTDAETTESDGRNTYFTSWMRIVSDDDGGVHAMAGDNWVKVVLYPDAEVPGGRNFKPCAMMNIARWGNAGYTDASTVADEGDSAEEMADKQVRAAEHLRRQQTLYLTADGRIMKLKQVNKPVVEPYMYGWVAGGSPESLYSDSSVRRRLVDGRDYVAVDGIIASQLIIAEKSQKPLVTYVDHGDWSATERYLFEQENASTLDAVGNPIVETSDVWHLGSRWRNLVADNVGHEPFWNSAFWLHVEGNAQLSMKFYTVDGVPYGDSISVRPSQVNVALVPHVFFGYEDISDRVGSWLWSRSVSPSLWTDPEYIDSETGEDTTVSSRSVRLTQSDLPSLWYESGVSFTCVATVGGATVSKSAEF